MEVEQVRLARGTGVTLGVFHMQSRREVAGGAQISLLEDLDSKGTSSGPCQLPCSPDSQSLWAEEKAVISNGSGTGCVDTEKTWYYLAAK